FGALAAALGVAACSAISGLDKLRFEVRDGSADGSHVASSGGKSGGSGAAGAGSGGRLTGTGGRPGGSTGSGGSSGAGGCKFDLECADPDACTTDSCAN